MFKACSRHVCHICEGRDCRTSEQCPCHLVSIASRGYNWRRCIPWFPRSSEENANLYGTLVSHCLDDDCDKALHLATKLGKSMHEINLLDFYVLDLLIKRKFQRAYTVLRHRDSFESYKKENLESFIFEESDVLEEVGWLCKKSALLSSKSNHFVHVVIPIIFIKLQQMQFLEEKKNFSFWAIMMGTHPRVGRNSPVRKIAGLTPVIQRMFSFCHLNYDRKIDVQISKGSKQLSLLFSLCKVRKLMVEILQLEEEFTGSCWKCRLCKAGQDCHEPKQENLTDHLPWEKNLRNVHGLSFHLLRKLCEPFKHSVVKLIMENQISNV